MDKILFETKAWKIVESEGDIFLVNKRFESEGRYDQHTEVTAETVDTCEIKGVKIPNYIRKELAEMFERLADEKMQAEIVEAKAAEFEAERERQKAEEVRVEQYNDTFLVEAPQGAFAFIIGRNFQIGYKDKHSEYFFEKLTFKGWFNDTDSLLFDDEEGNTLHLNPLGITYVWIKLNEITEKQARVDKFERYHDLLDKSLSRKGTTEEERIERHELYMELGLHDRKNLYKLAKEAHELRTQK